MKKREPKPMKPRKAWATVYKKTGNIGLVRMHTTKKAFMDAGYCGPYERIARVVITELRGKR